MRYTSHETHACEVHAHEVHASEVHANETLTNGGAVVDLSRSLQKRAFALVAGGPYEAPEVWLARGTRTT
jgi:hypothetical protein